jgi:hypothetical protein
MIGDLIGGLDIFIINMRNKNVLLLINRKIPEITLADNEVIPQIIIFVMNFSKSMNGSRYSMDFFNVHSQYNTVFFNLLPSSSLSSVCVVIIVANVYGSEENNEITKALLSSHPDVQPLLADVMEAIMNWDVSRTEIKGLMKKGFRYFNLNLSVVAVALRNLSISDENIRNDDKIS